MIAFEKFIQGIMMDKQRIKEIEKQVKIKYGKMIEQNFDDIDSIINNFFIGEAILVQIFSMYLKNGVATKASLIESIGELLKRVPDNVLITFIYDFIKSTAEEKLSEHRLLSIMPALKIYKDIILSFENDDDKLCASSTLISIICIFISSLFGKEETNIFIEQHLSKVERGNYIFDTDFGINHINKSHTND